VRRDVRTNRSIGGASVVAVSAAVVLVLAAPAASASFTPAQEAPQMRQAVESWYILLGKVIKQVTTYDRYALGGLAFELPKPLSGD
jgi:hypothetical protein